MPSSLDMQLSSSTLDSSLHGKLNARSSLELVLLPDEGNDGLQLRRGLLTEESQDLAAVAGKRG